MRRLGGDFLRIFGAKILDKGAFKKSEDSKECQPPRNNEKMMEVMYYAMNVAISLFSTDVR